MFGPLRGCLNMEDFFFSVSTTVEVIYSLLGTALEGLGVYPWTGSTILGVYYRAVARCWSLIAAMARWKCCKCRSMEDLRRSSRPRIFPFFPKSGRRRRMFPLSTG